MAGQGEGYGEVMNVSVFLLGGWGGRGCVYVEEGGGEEEEKDNVS